MIRCCFPFGTRLGTCRTVLYLLLLIIPSKSIAQPGPSSILKSILQNADTTYSAIVLAEGIVEPVHLLKSFYESGQYNIAWHDRSDVDEYLAVIRDAGSEGLDPERYHLKALEKYQTKLNSEREVAFFDLMLTDSFLDYSSDILCGKLDPEILYPGKWEADTPETNLVLMLRQALAGHTISASISNLKPGHPGYHKLKVALAHYKEIKANGGWPLVALDGPSILPGMTNEELPVVRKRLMITGQLTSEYQPPQETKYDSVLVYAVIKFQRQNGMRDDGIIGATAREALHSSVDDYINTLELNLERYRWLPQTFESRYLTVNIPAFTVDVYEQDSVVNSMRAIVGRVERTTPVLSSYISHLICNPTWTVPPTILKEDVLPAVRRNVGYLKEHHLRVINRNGGEVAPDNLPWSTYTFANFPYIVRQDPGPFNSLGLIKFEFHNHHSVFLHDTNSKMLFNEPFRALSSGCIRIERPLELAVYLFKGTSWNEAKFRTFIKSKVTGTVLLPQPFPIHIVYFTAFVGRDNQLQMRRDVYGWDKPAIEAIKVAIGR